MTAMQLLPLARASDGQLRRPTRVLADRLGVLNPVPLPPADEPERLLEIADLGVLDEDGTEALAALVRLASRLCDTAAAAVTIVDDSSEWYLASVGLAIKSIPRGRGLCSRAILTDEPYLEVPDTSRVAWFDPGVHGPGALPVQYYAAVPLRTRAGTAVGTLCVMDTKPRRLGQAQLASLQDIAQTVCSQLNLRRELRIATQIDGLTGLPNWRSFQSRFAAANPTCGAVCYIRLKSVSQIGSAHGFGVADALIRQAAARLRELASGGAFASRIKRNLFLVFFPDADADAFAREHAPEIAARLQAPYTVDGLSVVCPVHLGFAAFPRDGRTLDEVVRAADAALQLALERDEQAAFFDKAVDNTASQHFRLEPQLRAALERDELVNYYQPKVELGTGRMLGVEALVRWVHPQRGVIPPSQFVPALEATGLVREVGRRILLRAAQDWARWQRDGLAAPRIAVNVAAAQLRGGDLVQQLREALALAGGNPAALGIEVTESVLIGNMEQAIRVLEEVRSLGIPVAIDDFGTGYSSLAYIVTLPVDEVKIDRSFVARITEPAYRGIVATCVSLARNLRLRVVAEGVETAEQDRELQALQCDAAQGFLYGEPVPPQELGALLRPRP
jgi:predicted signal transduction protein with EAL and GGDEF domain